MDPTITGLVINFAFFAIGLYLYLFARGLISFGKEEARARAEAFRKDNATWMRFLGLALAAIMGLNLFLDIQTLLAAG